MISVSWRPSLTPTYIPEEPLNYNRAWAPYIVVTFSLTPKGSFSIVLPRKASFYQLNSTTIQGISRITNGWKGNWQNRTIHRRWDLFLWNRSRAYTDHNDWQIWIIIRKHGATYQTDSKDILRNCSRRTFLSRGMADPCLWGLISII